MSAESADLLLKLAASLIGLLLTVVGVLLLKTIGRFEASAAAVHKGEIADAEFRVEARTRLAAVEADVAKRDQWFRDISGFLARERGFVPRREAAPPPRLTAPAPEPRGRDEEETT